MNLISIADATDRIVGALTRCRTSAENASAVARALIAAELAGQPGHGLRRVAAYAAQAEAGKVDGYAQPGLASRKGSAILIDAALGFAYPALELGLEELVPLARANGIALCGIARSHHAGVAGVSVEALADKGLIALIFANAPAAMAPWGARQALFGTNPIAFAAPIAGGDPIVVDISLSKVARGKVMAAQQKGVAIPEGWAFDANGEPTTDPDLAMAGTMAPMGEAKGVALALMVEMLAAGLTGSRFSHEASSFFNAEGPAPAVGQTMIAIDPGAFGQPDLVLNRFAELVGAMAGIEGARVPGRRRQALRRAMLRDGIPADPNLLDEIDRIGRAPVPTQPI